VNLTFQFRTQLVDFSGTQPAIVCILLLTEETKFNESVSLLANGLRKLFLDDVEQELEPEDSQPEDEDIDGTVPILAGQNFLAFIGYEASDAAVAQEVEKNLTNNGIAAVLRWVSFQPRLTVSQQKCQAQQRNDITVPLHAVYSFQKVAQIFIRESVAMAS
jgi:hypothetical protein